MITLSSSGSTDRTRRFLDKMSRPQSLFEALDGYGRRGVEALRAHTPTDTGLTANSWGYEIEIGKESSKIYWTNSNSVNGVNIAIILQYGHATGTGGYVAGRDYINPALKPIFDEIANAVWKKVTSA